MLVAEPGPEHVGEEVVVAVPGAVIVERDDEEVGPLELLERRSTARPTGDGIAERPGERLQDRGLEQEAADVVALAFEHLPDQVVEDEAIVAGEPGDERRDIVATLHRERRELQGRDPSLGARLEHVDVGCVDGQPHLLVEVGGGFVGREAQVGGPVLEQLTARSQAGQRQGWVGAARDHEVHLRRKALDQERHRLVDLRRLDQVVVVEHEHQIVVHREQVVEQRRHDRLGVRLRLLQPRPRVGAHLGHRRAERGDDVVPEQPGLVVAPVEREPGGGRSVGEQLGDERGLAEPGGRGHEREHGLPAEVEPLAQSRAVHDRAAPSGRVQPGLDEGDRTVSHARPMRSPWP